MKEPESWKRIKKMVSITDEVDQIIQNKADKMSQAMGINSERAFSMALRTIVLEWNNTQAKQIDKAG